MRRTVSIAILLAAATLAAASAGLGADSPRTDSPSKRWHAADQCNRDAFKKYPDYTQEGAAKRQAYVDQCLRERGLPPQSNSTQTKPAGQ